MRQTKRHGISLARSAIGPEGQRPASCGRAHFGLVQARQLAGGGLLGLEVASNALIALMVPDEDPKVQTTNSKAVGAFNL
jgi:hypothetical protein